MCDALQICDVSMIASDMGITIAAVITFVHVANLKAQSPQITFCYAIVYAIHAISLPILNRCVLFGAVAAI